MTKGIASWGWSTVPQKHLERPGAWYTQAKVIGGGSSINAQVYARGNAGDYDAWALRKGCAGWSYATSCPISSGPRTISASPTSITATAGRWACRCPVNPLPINEAFLRAAQEYGIPYNLIQRG